MLRPDKRRISLEDDGGDYDDFESGNHAVRDTSGRMVPPSERAPTPRG
jgi:hypothetical protein